MVWRIQDSTQVKRYTPGKTSVEYFREFMKAIREVIGDE
jgi:alpha-galactosidase